MAKAKPGRKLKSGVRHPSGKLVQPPPNLREQATLSVAMNNPERRPFKEMARSQYAGTPLGRLRLSQQITVEQYDALIRAGGTIGRYLLTLPNLPAVKRESLSRYTKDDFDVEYAPQDNVDRPLETKEEQDERAAVKYDALMRALDDKGARHFLPVLKKAEIDGQDLWQAEIAALRVLANALELIYKPRKAAA